MGFKPLEEIEGPIVLKIRGHEYTIPTVMWEDGVKLQAKVAAGGVTFDDVANFLLGPNLLRELTEAGAPAAVIDRVGAVALADWQFGREAAEEVWENPKGLLDRVETMAAATEAAIAAARAAEPTTSSQASTSTTTSPKAKAPRSRSKTSSRTGSSS